MYYKKRKNNKRTIKKVKKPRYKVTFISFDDPRVVKELEKKVYEEYLRDIKSESGDED